MAEPPRRRLALNLSRQVLGLLGLVIGGVLYALTGRLVAPWDSVGVGVLFALLGLTALWYARGERWIQVLGLLLLLYGVARAVWLH
ncbi:hypothetical protein [Deinococcus sonorensis]|uniref:Uncharacterized protein n=2 Tax=Deinococcus sonorensis TaxID=309891 RepID=A0AAU7UDN0_9DEIO